MAHHLIPSNTTIKAIKPGDVRNRLADGAGLYLKLFVNGGSHGWRFDYSLNGRRNTLSLGTYPPIPFLSGSLNAQTAIEQGRAEGNWQSVRPSCSRRRKR